MKHKPGSVDEDAVKELYALAYGEGGRHYEELKSAAASTIPSTSLLGKTIVSSSHTTFSDFLNALNATAWVNQDTGSTSTLQAKNALTANKTSQTALRTTLLPALMNNIRRKWRNCMSLSRLIELL